MLLALPPVSRTSAHASRRLHHSLRGRRNRFDSRCAEGSLQSSTPTPTHALTVGIELIQYAMDPSTSSPSPKGALYKVNQQRNYGAIPYPSSLSRDSNSMSSESSKSKVPSIEETVIPVGALPLPPSDQDARRGLHRGLSARQVQMIAIAGTIGTGLFLGTGRSLAQGGPGAVLICYTLIGFIVYVTLLLLGEMATQYPVAGECRTAYCRRERELEFTWAVGSFNTYATRFFSPSYGFALSWNYWFNDAVSVAGDLVAAQLVLQFWTTWNLWVISLIFWAFLVSLNAIHVKAYGELGELIRHVLDGSHVFKLYTTEYWLASLKVATILVFIILGILVNVGVNTDHKYIGGSNWRIEGAPFRGGFGGFARVFVTASFAYGGTESLGVTAGETKNPSRNMPRVVKAVFWRRVGYLSGEAPSDSRFDRVNRILIFYVLSILLIGLNGKCCHGYTSAFTRSPVTFLVPWDYPNLSNKSTTTSPFTIIFEKAGSSMSLYLLTKTILRELTFVFSCRGFFHEHCHSDVCSIGGKPCAFRRHSGTIRYGYAIANTEKFGTYAQLSLRSGSSQSSA
ncbi:amino acid permease-domain-containing protein [Salix suchowensis]|nr:amino acid permease-domain-containing protein [Salix suchowensis]